MEMMMDQDRPPLHGHRTRCKRSRLRTRWKRSRPRSPSADAKDVKDLCACVRFLYRSCPGTVKWLRLKIPGILIEKIEASCCPQSESKRLRSTSSSGISTSGNADFTHCHQSGMEVYPSTHHIKLRNCFNKMVSQRYVTCELDPVINGPFTCPFPHGEWITAARHASIGSVVFVLAAYDDHFDPKARQQVLSELRGYHPTREGSLPRQLVFGPPITGGKRLNSCPPKLPPNCKSDNTCYHLLYCDFNKPKPQWKMSPQPLVSPRIVPKLISLQGILFAFGGNCPSDLNAPFAEAFDPAIGYWEPLPTPPFGRLGLYELYVFPLPTSGRILVAGAKSCILYTFNLSTWCWHPFETNYFNQEFNILYSLPTRIRPRSYPVLSVFDEAIYWLDRFGRLCVYNVVGDGKYYAGHIKGLHLEGGGRLLKHVQEYLALLPLSKQLMGLLWLSSDGDDLSHFSCSLHITILHISVSSENTEMDMESEDPEAFYAFMGIPLTVSSVACLSFPLDNETDRINVIDACLMDEGDVNIF